MPVNIGKFVIAGELHNERRNSVFGWIEFAEDYGVRLELTGNLSGALSGKTIRFSIPEDQLATRPEPGDFPNCVEELANRQIGAVGEIAAMGPTVDQIGKLQGDGLRIRWFSQNGEVLAEIPNAVFETFVEHDKSTDFSDGIAEFDLEDDAIENELVGDEDEEEGDDDPYGLFSESLDAQVAESLNTEADSVVEPSENNEKRSWDEVIPGIDPETKEMYEQWDEIFEGKHDEPLSYLFQTPMRLPKPDAVNDNETAAPLVTSILAQLALLSVALDVCEHFEPVQTYRLLVNEILPNAKVHPNLAATEMVQHYATSDYCDQCEAEFEAEMNDADEPNDSDDTEMSP